MKKVENVKLGLKDKLVKMAKIEQLINNFYKRLNEMIRATNDIRKVIGNTMARYLVTDQQVLRFEAHFVKHFDDALQQKMQKEFQKFTFDMEHARNEAVNNFTAEIKGGWWFSSKVGWFLYMRRPLATDRREEYYHHCYCCSRLLLQVTCPVTICRNVFLD